MPTKLNHLPARKGTNFQSCPYLCPKVEMENINFVVILVDNR